MNHELGFRFCVIGDYIIYCYFGLRKSFMSMIVAAESMSTSLTVDRRSSFDSTNSSRSVLALLAICSVVSPSKSPSKVRVKKLAMSIVSAQTLIA